MTFEKLSGLPFMCVEKDGSLSFMVADPSDLHTDGGRTYLRVFTNATPPNLRRFAEAVQVMAAELEKDVRWQALVKAGTVQ